jgi:hypothetical protein
MPLTILLTLRPVEPWTLGTSLASAALLLVVLVAIAWWVSAATAGHDRDDERFGGRS